MTGDAVGEAMRRWSGRVSCRCVLKEQADRIIVVSLALRYMSACSVRNSSRRSLPTMAASKLFRMTRFSSLVTVKSNRILL